MAYSHYSHEIRIIRIIFMEEGKYIYCIISANRDQRLRVVGINNQEAVNLVHCKDIAAVVSNTPVINFDRLDKKELTKYVAIHQKVNETVMSAKGGSAPGGKDYDLVPMTFGIIAPSTDELMRILERAYLQFKTALETIKGKAEFVVQVWWDQKKLLTELTNINPEIQKLKQIAVLKAGVLRMPTKLKLGKLIHQEIETQRKAFVNDVQQTLGNLAYDSTQNKLIEDDMIANFSFLVEKARESEVDRKMQELGKRYEDDLRFKYIGPMPPYSFVNINLSLGNFELVNGARKLLGLPEIATFEEIKKAYYELAHQYHPDKFQGKEDQMKKIVQAYNILESYCQSCDVKGSQYSFKEEDVKNSLIIS